MFKQTVMGLARAVTLGIRFAGSAEAVQITLSGIDYEISTVTGTYNDLLPDLSNSPWFASESLSSIASGHAALGFNVLFAFSENSSSGTGSAFSDGSSTLSVLNREILDPDYFTRVNTFAFAQRVSHVEPERIPEPASIFGLLTIGVVAARGALKKKVAA